MVETVAYEVVEEEGEVEVSKYPALTLAPVSG